MLPVFISSSDFDVITSVRYTLESRRFNDRYAEGNWSAKGPFETDRALQSGHSKTKLRDCFTTVCFGFYASNLLLILQVYEKIR